MKYYNNILETIGNTPLVKLNKVTQGIPATILAKVETFNPGHSIKDRMAVKMIEDAEKSGELKPGGTIIEGTSGNTGMGLAMVAIIKGYKLICTLADKQSKEKMDILRAMGAEVIVCPTNVSSDDPRSYYSVAKKLNEEIPNSFYPNQYDNLSNRQAHYEQTGPEIWEQTEGKITHLVVGVGTGGTISGTAKYLKEKNPNIKVWGIDTYGSVFKKYHETGIFDEKEIYPYILEGVGEDILPKNVDFDLIDLFEKVTDKDAAIMTRRMAREEGLLVGYSAGSALQGILQLQDQLKEGDVVVAILHDHGSRYINKVYNDQWMLDNGFLEERKLIREWLEVRENNSLILAESNDLIHEVIEKMQKKRVSKVPVFEKDKPVGSVRESTLLKYLIENPNDLNQPISTIMEASFDVVDYDSTLDEVTSKIQNSG